MLTLQNINLTLNKGSKLERQLLQNLDLHVENKEFIAVIGGNGSGKSTLLNVISGFLPPSSGKIMLAEKNITNMSQILRSSFIAKVMQDPKVGTLENMSILENMAFALKRGQQRSLTLYSRNIEKKILRDKLAMLSMGLENRLDDLVNSLSGGQRQALSLIMAVIADAKILLLDEITAALDPKSAEVVIQLANRIVREENRTCIMVTHNMAHAIQYADRILILQEGNFIKEFNHAEKQLFTAAKLAAEIAV